MKRSTVYFTNEHIQKAQEISWWVRFKLLFHSKRYHIDRIECKKVTYKIMNKNIYILDVSDIPPQPYNCRCSVDYKQHDPN